MKQAPVPRFDADGEEIVTSAKAGGVFPRVVHPEPEPVDVKAALAKNADARKVIEGVVDGLAATGKFREKLEETLWSMLDSERLEWAYCDNCRSKVRVPYPDYRGRAQALATFLDQAKGRPTERRELEVKVRTLSEMEQLSDEELQRFIEAGQH